MNFNSKRITRDYRQTINAKPEKIFPLLCPEREKEWLDGWDYHMIHSESGFAELGAIFSTSAEGENDTIWIITKYDPVNNHIQFARVTPNSRTSILDISVLPKNGQSSFVDIRYSYTSISDNGNKFISEYTKEVFLEMMIFWEKSMNYFIENGIKLIKKHSK